MVTATVNWGKTGVKPWAPKNNTIFDGTCDLKIVARRARRRNFGTDGRELPVADPRLTTTVFNARLPPGTGLKKTTFQLAHCLPIIRILSYAPHCQNSVTELTSSPSEHASSARTIIYFMDRAVPSLPSTPAAAPADFEQENDHGISQGCDCDVALRHCLGELNEHSRHLTVARDEIRRANTSLRTAIEGTSC
ncbi:hypothetical protein CPC08DRAFT_724020 [Agrocybe pediades]|nr:hypothetical protein CPC08DRAFT_724020 [Agrocybe pediades]